MSLRRKLFLLISGLAILLVAAQWLMVRALTRDIAGEVGEVAVSVGRDMASVLVIDKIGTFHTGSNLVFPIDEAHIVGVQPEKEVIEFITEKKYSADGQQVWVERKTKDGYEWSTKYSFPKNGSDTPTATATTMVTTSGFDGQSRVTHSGSGETTFFSSDTNNLKTRSFSLHLKDEDGLIVKADDQVREIQLPTSGVDSALNRLSNRLMLGSAGILALGLLAGGVLAHRVSRPLTRLSYSAKEVGEGRLGVTTPVPRGDREVREAVLAFNHMSLRLKDLDEQNQRHQQRQALSELGEIARGFAHTIRNPLNTLGLAVEELGALAGDKPRARHLVTNAQQQIRRIDGWIRSFLALASEGKGQVEDIHIEGLIQDVALEAMHDNRARIKVDIIDQLPSVRGVAPELRAVIQALVVNAVEAGPDGGEVRILADHDANARKVRIFIKDEGPGLSEEVRERLFTPHTTTKTHGSGMGLFLAHRIARGRYRGDLELNNRESGGCTATLTLPEENDYDPHPAC